MINWSSFKVVGKELEYINDAFKSGWVSDGDYIRKLEREMESIFNGSIALAVSNGTSALQLAFQTIGLKPGDHVIVPSFCFQAAGNVLYQLNAKPVYCDIDPLYWNQTVSTIENAITSRTVGVVVVHNYGVAASIQDISKWVKEHGLWLIEDCAEAWFTKHCNRYVGQYGDISTFSMHATKTIACGEGGVILINNKSLNNSAQLLRSHGLGRQKIQYYHECAGNNYRLSNLLAAVACAQLEQREFIINKQKYNASIYKNELKGHWAIQTQVSHKNSEDYLWAVAISIRFDALKIERDELIEILRDNGIEVRPGFYSASVMSYNNKKYINSFVTDRLHKTIIVLPCSINLTKGDIENVCKILKNIINDNIKEEYDYQLIEMQGVIGAEIVVRDFYESLSLGKNAFRYYDTRDYSVIQTHIITLMIKVGEAYIGYGHLERYDNKVWLGIAIADKYTDMGWGKVMMQALILKAEEKSISNISLRVDKTNVHAIMLYKRYGFKISDENVMSSSNLMILQR
jgi:perosamine synthetase